MKKRSTNQEFPLSRWIQEPLKDDLREAKFVGSIMDSLFTTRKLLLKSFYMQVSGLEPSCGTASSTECQIFKS